MIIAVTHIKGGVGKSSIAINLAFMRSMRSIPRDRVLLVDADKQGTVSDWVQHRQASERDTPWSTIKLTGANIKSEVSKLSSNYDTVIIDVGGTDSHSMRAALLVADIALIPCPPRSFDLWSMDQLIELIDSARKWNPDLKAKAFINFGDTRSDDNTSAKELIRGFSGIEMLSSVISNRKTFVNSSARGNVLSEERPPQMKAMEELRALVDELFGIS